MSYVGQLVEAYDAFVALPWQDNLAPPQRVWMAPYPPDDERRLRLHVPEFEAATTKHGHKWSLLDITTSFEKWMASHEYRDGYFDDPELLETALPAFFEILVQEVRSFLEVNDAADGVAAVLGAGALFGLGDAVKVSALLNEVCGAVSGRILMFFAGEVENNNFRLLDARDGWNYVATVIAPNGRGR